MAVPPIGTIVLINNYMVDGCTFPGIVVDTRDNWVEATWWPQPKDGHVHVAPMEDGIGILINLAEGTTDDPGMTYRVLP